MVKVQLKHAGLSLCLSAGRFVSLRNGFTSEKMPKKKVAQVVDNIERWWRKEHTNSKKICDVKEGKNSKLLKS